MGILINCKPLLKILAANPPTSPVIPPPILIKQSCLEKLFFNKMFKILADTFRKISSALTGGDSKFIKALKVMNPAMYLGATKLGPRVATSMANKFEKEAPKILKILGDILKVLIPSLIAAGAMLQILLNGEYEGEPDSPVAADAEANPPASTSAPPPRQSTAASQTTSTPTRVPQQQRAAAPAPAAATGADKIKSDADDILKQVPRRKRRVAEKKEKEKPAQITPDMINNLLKGVEQFAKDPAVIDALGADGIAGALEIIKSKIMAGEQPAVGKEQGLAGVMEKKLTEPEKKEKEKVVKGMKKNKKDFKKRYGDDAESVMYATATKIAKEKK